MKNNILKTQTQKFLNRTGNHKVLKYLIYVFYFWFFIFNFANALPISRDSLSCGLRVLTYETDRLPMIEMRWVAYAGSAYDPAGKDGLANLAVKMLSRGTKSRPALQISKALEMVGASMREAAGYDASSLHMQFLSKDLDLALDVLSDMLLNSTFPETELNKVKLMVLGEIKQSYDYPNEIGWQKFSELLYQKHPYAHDISGDTSTVRNISRKDIADFYSKYYTIDNGFLVVAGDFNKDELLRKIETKFRAMPKGKPVVQIPEFSSKPYSDKPKGYIIQRDDLNQSYVYIGFGGMAETSSDYFSSRVMNFILGGSPLTSRIGNAVRETGGLAYDARSGFYRRQFGGAFVATTQTSDPQKGIKFILEEIKKIRDFGVTPKELKDAQTFYTGNFPFNYDATRDKVDLLQNIEMYQKGLDYPDKFNSYIEKLTIDEINQAARKYLYPDNYLMVIVTNLNKTDLGIENIDWLN